MESCFGRTLYWKSFKSKVVSGSRAPEIIDYDDHCYCHSDSYYFPKYLGRAPKTSKKSIIRYAYCGLGGVPIKVQHYTSIGTVRGHHY